MLSNYDLVNDMATHGIVKGYVGDTSQNLPKEFISKEDLYNKLSLLEDYSKVDESYIKQSFNDGAVTITFYIGENSKEFCKNNIETIIFFFIFVYMMWLHKKEKFNLKSVGMGFIVCGLAKFLLDYLRSVHTSTLSVNQIVSIMFAVIGLACVINKAENKI